MITIIYIILSVCSYNGGVVERDIAHGKQMTADVPSLKLHMDSVSKLQGELIPSKTVIRGFLDDALQTWDTGTVFDLTHAKRLRISKNVYRKAGVETAWGEAKHSHTARKCNNHFGTKLNKRITPRATRAGRLRMAKYDRWTDAYVDVIEFHIKTGGLW